MQPVYGKRRTKGVIPPENMRSEMWQVAQPATLCLRATVNQVTLAATL